MKSDQILGLAAMSFAPGKSGKIVALTPELSRAVNGAATRASVANARRRRNETASA